jgi:hypothetical protein
MKSIFAFIASLILTSVSSIVLEYLIHTKGYPSYFVLLIRGVIGFILCSSVAKFKGLNALPRKWNLQGYRLINAGLILLLVFQSYKYLSATSVSLLQRLDIPFLIILSSILKDKKSVVQLSLSILAVLSTCYFISSSLLTEEQEMKNQINVIGFLLSGGSALLLAFSYILLKKTSKIDNAFVITNITCISTTVFGLIATLVNGYNWTIHLSDIWLFLLASVILVSSYYYSMELYKQFTAEIAQIPSVLAVIVTMGIEMIIKNKWFNPTEISVITFLVILTVFISLNINYAKYFKSWTIAKSK